MNGSGAPPERVKTILVVEDDDQVRSMMVKLLAREGFRTVEASNGQLGLRMAREYIPDLIISDVEMPGLDGHAMLRELRADPTTAIIPFVFLTGRGDRDDVRFGMNIGADDYVTKPFELDEVLGAVQSRLARRDALAARFQEKLDQLHITLTSSLPHELRTPLTGILGYSAILIDHPDQIGRDELLLAARTIKTSAERLQRYVENFLIYAELASTEAMTGDSPAPAIGNEPSDVGACAERVIAARANLHGREADVRSTLRKARVRMPEVYLHRALDELVDNAFRYSSRDTPVEVTCEAAGRMIKVAVIDRGRGLTPEQIREINAFVQFDRRRYEQQGLGLGLALTKRLVERYGGMLEIERTPDGQTSVTMVLPEATDAEARARISEPTKA